MVAVTAEKFEFNSIVDAEHEERKKSEWRERLSMRIIMLVVLVGDMQRGILFPTLWPYVSMLGGDRIAQGFVVAAFSTGRFFSSPLMGKLSVTEGYRMVLSVSLIIMTVGAFEYILASNIWMVVFAQSPLSSNHPTPFKLMMGFGSGTVGVTRAYVAEKSEHEHRTVMLARLTAFQYVGFTCTPFIGALLSTWLGPVHSITESNLIFNGRVVYILIPLYNHALKGKLRWEFDAFTAPGWCMCFMGILSIILLNTVFVDSIPSPKRASKASFRGMPLNTPDTTLTRKKIGSDASLNAYGALDQDVAAEETVEENGSELWTVIFGGFVGNIMTKGSIACYETLSIEYAIDKFNWKSNEAGYVVALFGAFGSIALFSMRTLLKFGRDIQLIIWGIFVMCASAMLLSLAPIAMQLTSPNSGMGSLIFFVSLFMMYSVGYPIGHTVLVGLFSKVIGKRPQGEIMGWFGSCGSLARIIYPIGAGIISQELGTQTLFALVGSLLALVAITACIVQRKYEPYL